jgi:hypothetical protein
MDTIKKTRGLELEALLKLLADQKERSRDFVARPSAIEAVAGNNGVNLHVKGAGLFAPTSWASSQLASVTDIPKAYYDRIAQENPSLLADAVNHGISRLDGSRVVRTVGETVRAVVSDRYFALDSFDLLRETLPTLYSGGFQVQESEISDRRLYVRAVSPRTTTDVRKGDPVQFGVSISTSDVGGGALKVEPFFYRLACLNGMVLEQTLAEKGREERRKMALRRNHNGGRIEFEGDTFLEFLTDETREKKAAAIFSETRDMIRGLSDTERFRELVERMQTAANREITNNNVETVVARAMSATSVVGKEIQADIIGELLRGNQGAGFTQWGLANSFTAQAHKTDDSDRADALMRAGGRIINLTESEWKKVAA